MPGRERSRCRTGEILLRRGRQRLRLFRHRVQIGDDVGALAVLRDAGKAHRGAGNEGLGVGEELVEVVKGPVAALALHASREIEAATTGPFRLVDDTVEVRTNAVRATLLEGVAGGAFLGSAGTLLDRGGLQQLLDRLGGSRGFLGATAARRLP